MRVKLLRFLYFYGLNAAKWTHLWNRAQLCCRCTLQLSQIRNDAVSLFFFIIILKAGRRDRSVILILSKRCLTAPKPELHCSSTPVPQPHAHWDTTAWAIHRTPPQPPPPPHLFCIVCIIQHYTISTDSVKNLQVELCLYFFFTSKVK